MLSHHESEIKSFQESRAYRALKEMFQGGRPLIFVCTPEEGRVRMLLQEWRRQLFSRPNAGLELVADLGLQPSGRQAQRESSARLPSLILLPRTAHRESFSSRIFISSCATIPEFARRLRDLYELCMDSGKFIVITSPLRAHSRRS